MYNDLLFRLEKARLGSCTCLTKTPDAAHHAADCRYRVLHDASAAIKQQQAMLLSQGDHHSHRCIRCCYGYSPSAASETEDCPVCGHDGSPLPSPTTTENSQ